MVFGRFFIEEFNADDGVFPPLFVAQLIASVIE